MSDSTELILHADKLGTVLSTISVGIVGAVWKWVTSQGGLAGIRRWLLDLQATDRDEARLAIKIGLTAAAQQSKEEEERLVGELISGMDRWRLLSAEMKSRSRTIDASKWLVFAQFGTMAIFWVVRFLAVEWVPEVALVWFLLVFALVFFAGGIAKLAFERPPEATRPKPTTIATPSSPNTKAGTTSDSESDAA